MSHSYTSAEQNARGRKNVVMKLEQDDGHETRGIPDLLMLEQVTTYSNGKERMTQRHHAYKWNGKRFTRAGLREP